jgi:hypothetical protein
MPRMRSRADLPPRVAHSLPCLDERSSDLKVISNAKQLLRALRDDEEGADNLRGVLGVPNGKPIPLLAAAAYCPATALVEELERSRRAGWTVLATDVHGLPWLGERRLPSSHGTWGIHERCGTRQRMTDGALDCRSCGPDSNSRTHLARQNDPYLLYLVRFGSLQKFGVGNARRVREHLRAGARVLQILAAHHADVVAAERTLKARHHGIALPPTGLVTPPSFGKLTEVMPAKTPIDLTEVLPQGHDRTYLFQPPKGLSHLG